MTFSAPDFKQIIFNPADQSKFASYWQFWLSAMYQKVTGLLTIDGGTAALRKDFIRFRRDMADIWTRVNPTLASGEPGFETDTGKLKVGNGTDVWTDLPYI